MGISLNSSKPFAVPFATSIPDFKGMFALHQANIEALFQANTVLANGFQEIGKHVATLFQVECERAAAASSAALAASSRRLRNCYPIQSSSCSWRETVLHRVMSK
jgi:hypothetical protein